MSGSGSGCVEDKDYAVRVPGMHEWRGIVCPTDMTPSICQWLEDGLSFQEGDVVIQSFGSSGTKWCQEVLYLIHHPEDADKEPKDRGDMGFRVPFLEHYHLEIEPKDIIKNMKTSRVFKGHLYPDILGKHVDEGKVKVIHWTMDPRDALVTYFHKLNLVCGRFLGWDTLIWDDFFESFKRHQLIEGDWFDWTLGWIPYLEKKNMLVVYYEDVAQDLEGTVRKIAEFCGKSLSDDLVAKIAGCTPYDKKGPLSQYKPEQLEYINKVFRDRMKGTIYESRYTD